jgi:[ribosomal protein S5]-alanine N-acetyltransferase
MIIFIEKLQKSDAAKLLEFEIENRMYFEEMVPSRGDDYYTPEVFNNSLSALLDEQLQGISQFYLIKDNDQNIVGRINLVDFDEKRKICHLGYRIGEKHSSKGIASKALSLLLHSLKNSNIEIIQAKTTTNNIGSQRVLEKNDFEKISISQDHVQLNSLKVNFVFYQWTRPV